MNDDLNEFERVARARLHRELGRVPVPAGRSSRARPRSTQGWGARIVGGSALVAMLALVALIAVGSVRVPPEASQAATQTAQTAGGPGAERLILLSSTSSSTLVRAVNPATRQVLWTVENPAQADSGPAWIDGAVAPDGSRVFVATRAGLIAYDAASGQSLWTKDPASAEQIVRHVPGQPSALAVAADGQSLYIQKEGGPNGRWLDVLDAATGNVGAGIELPASDGQVFALADQLYYVTSSQVFMTEPRSHTFSLTRAVNIPGGVGAAGPARDGRSIYVSNGEILLNLDRDGLTAPLPAKYQPLNMPKLSPKELEDLLNSPNTIVDTFPIDREDPRLWHNGPLALSPDGTTAAAWEFGDQNEPPRLKIYDLASWKPIAMFADLGTSKDHWLRGDTLHFNPAGTAIYAIAGPRGSGGGDGALVSLNVADGSPTRLIELPGETVAGLLMASPSGAPVLAADPAQPSPAPTLAGVEPVMPAPPFTLPDLESMPRIPMIREPLVPSGQIGWLLHDDQLLALDRDGSIAPPITDSAVVQFRWAVPRPGKKPLLLVSLADGRDAVLDPETAAITPLDLPGRSIKPPFVLSPDGAQLVFKRSSPGLPDALAQADLASGATWTLLDAAALGEHAAWLGDGSLIGWGRSGIYFEVTSPISTPLTIKPGAAGPHSLRLVRIQPRAGAADPAPPQLETLLELSDGGWLSLSPATGQVAYRGVDEVALHLLDTRSGQEQKVDVISSGAFALSPDGSQLAYVQLDGEHAYSLRIYAPQSGQIMAVARLTYEQSGTTSFRWSADGRYLILLTPGESMVVQVFDIRTFVAHP
jgi:hypothetical protein